MKGDYNYSLEKYVEITCNQLEMIPEEIIIHRLTGDAPRDTLVGPMWSLKKWEALNAIDEELLRRNSYQGKFNVRKEVLHATNSLTF